MGRTHVRIKKYFQAICQHKIFDKYNLTVKKENSLSDLFGGGKNAPSYVC